MIAVVNSVLRDGFYTGVPSENTDAFVVNRATLGASTDVSDLVSFVEVGADGDYDMRITPPAAGTLRMRWTTESGQIFTGSYDVLPAAADPAAIADSIAAVQTTVDGVAAMTDVATSTRATPGAYVSTGSAVATNGDVTVYQGYDQYAVDSRALFWSSTTVDQWPDLTGATIALATSGLAISGSVITPTGATKQVRVELTRTQTAALSPGVYDYQVYATLANGHVVPLAEGKLTVRARRG